MKRLASLTIGALMTAGMAGAEVPKTFAQRLVADADMPFAVGPIKVIATEYGRLRTYTLTPCVTFTRVCNAQIRGPNGVAMAVSGYPVAAGVPGRRVFVLQQGGGGQMQGPAGTVPLAWE